MSAMTLAAPPDSLESIRFMIRSLQRRRFVSRLDGDERHEYRRLLDAESALIADRTGPS